MNVEHLVWLITSIVILTFPSSVTAQGFANLGSQAEGFTVPNRGTPLDFPEDHAPHKDFRIEWWYLTANLKDERGEDFGAQWTLFRSALEPGEAEGWSSPQIWMGHAALTDSNHHFFEEQLARGGIGEAGVLSSPFHAWIGNWQMSSQDSELDQLRVTASGSDFSYDLQLIADGPLILHGDRGYSVKSPSGQASYYYSQPNYQITGTLTFEDREIAVSGSGWLDREWSSQPLAEDQSGWDWFSLKFESGDKLMGFNLRGQTSVFTSGTWISADGKATPLAPGELSATPTNPSSISGKTAPTSWRISLPRFEVGVQIDALNTESWMRTRFPYWEGPVIISGSHQGRGYLEMTGYKE